MQKMVWLLVVDNNCVHIGLQEPFDTSLQKAPAKYWVWDGVLSMPSGHRLIAWIWINEASKHFGFIKK